MKISSDSFEHGGIIPQKYTCDGDNAHPPLTFDGVPGEAKSLVLIMDDPDVPKDRIPSGVFDHWVVFNIPPRSHGVRETESAIEGTYGQNSREQNAYTGPCPPDREHRYFFKLYALDTQLALKKGAKKADVLEAIEGHVIAKAELMGKYNRPENQK
jgi:Raf kinase inhibitor-like YbhB/YbcL family protein